MLKPKGKLALHSTILSGNTALVRDILRVSKDVNKVDDSENSPLHVACIKGYTEIIRLLLASGADIDIKNHHGSSPLHLAVQFNNTSAAMLLVEKGADVNARDRYGDTPLHFAVSNNNIILVKKLIAVGAQLNAINFSFLTPLASAIKNSNKTLIVILEEAGAVTPKGFMETASYAFRGANIFRKLGAMTFIFVTLWVAILTGMMDFGKLSVTIPLAIMASIGFLIVCFDKPYRRIRSLEARVLNEYMTQDEVDRLLFSRKQSPQNNKIDSEDFVIKDAVNDNTKIIKQSNRLKKKQRKISL